MGNQVNNYQSIAVVSALSKVMERFINKRLRDFKSILILFHHSHLVSRKKSTSNAVHELTSMYVSKTRFLKTENDSFCLRTVTIDV